ncbi:PQQ-dependent sugar dehydrogenase [Alkalibacterium pelagium]|uniref:Glucose/arabinose dehydrogenase, beta-propeller fold n=1 Tax=Alkalibacterium pelagium TaxID=426702 RepID=A0A1H7FID6_9LACT|nr:PQQ-dependent sugar dehydrogenase [Alkalibacterium pelagium]GEN49419.1 dehydrogenase [Alkalibacterium pelagium]SEK23055.1 Glucose/arabinose dehydrogenase, beta-propeller fold [Alkalibacterium pelagium]
MYQKITLLVALFILLVGCTENNEQDTERDSIDNNGESSEESDQTDVDEPDPTEDDEPDEQEPVFSEPEVIAENLEIPWAIEIIDNTFYLTERPGYITRIEDGETVRQTVELNEAVSTVPEAGLLGFVLDPDFLENSTAYAYCTYDGSNGSLNRIVTLQLNEGVWREENVLLDEIPSGRVHHGGRLAIGPDGLLYATTGDASIPELAQDLESLAGKILRLNRDGSIPSDNPFADSYVYSYGHRNPQGLTWSSEGTMYSSEHGATANDEINLIEAGENYGWPIIEGEEENEGMITPLFTSGSEETWAPSGMDYSNGRVYVAGLRGAAIYELDIETGEQREVVSGMGRIRDIRIEDNQLYFISNNTDGRGNPEENDDKLYQLSIEN